MAKQITRDEWLAELAASLKTANQPDDEGFTRAELAKACEMGRSRVAVLIRQKLESGEWVQGMATRRDSMNRPQRVPVYREARP